MFRWSFLLSILCISIVCIKASKVPSSPAFVSKTNLNDVDEGHSFSRQQSWENSSNNQKDDVAVSEVPEKEATESEETPSVQTEEKDENKEKEDEIPIRFVRMQKGNLKKAKRAYEATLKWRKEKDADRILLKPHAKFDECKALLPHVFLGWDVTQHVIFCQRPGFLDLEMMQRGDVTIQELVMHYVYVLEYCWGILEPSSVGTMTNLIDMTGVSFGKVKELLGFVKQFVSMMSLHYPQRSYKTLLINCPKWFGLVFRLIKPLLRESTIQKIHILNGGKEQEDVMMDCLGFVPQYLQMGEPSVGWKELPLEVDLRNYCMERVVESSSSSSSSPSLAETENCRGTDVPVTDSSE